MFVGVDVHTAHVYAVLVDESGLVAHVASPTGESASDAIRDALRALVAAEPAATRARSVTVCNSTPSSTLVRPERLGRCASIRLCSSDAETAPPLAGWPAELRAAVGGPSFVCRGGNVFDGRASRPLDVVALRQIAEQIRGAGIDVVAVTSVFASVNSADELEAASVLTAAAPGLRVCLSHEIGSLGLFERENATIANAALLPHFERAAEAIAGEVRTLMPHAGAYFAQNDGTAMELALARRYPILTLWSGRSAAINGAASLANLADCVVVDARRDVSYIGTAVRGYPRQGRHDVEVVGIPMSLHHPELTEVCPGAPGGFGPDDVERLDLAVRRADPRRRRPVVLVGPGSATMPTAFAATRPRHGGVAGAFGAATSPIGSEVDCILSGEAASRAAARASAETLALHKAVMAGADDRTVHVHEVEEIPLAYLPGDVVRLRIKAIGLRR